jgi:hypothetical protein
VESWYPQEAKDLEAEAFAEHFTRQYEDFARENPIYAELKQVTQAVAVAKWMQQQNIPVDWNFVRLYAMRIALILALILLGGCRGRNTTPADNTPNRANQTSGAMFRGNAQRTDLFESKAVKQFAAVA